MLGTLLLLTGLVRVEAFRFTPLATQSQGWTRAYSRSVAQSLGSDGKLHAFTRQTEASRFGDAASAELRGIIKECRDGACSEARLRERPLDKLFDAAIDTFDNVGSFAWSFLDGAPLSPALFHQEEATIADGVMHLHPATLWEASAKVADNSVLAADSVASFAWTALDGAPLSPQLFHDEADAVKSASKVGHPIQTAFDSVGSFAWSALDGAPLSPELFHATGSPIWSELAAADFTPRLNSAEAMAVMQHTSAAAGKAASKESGTRSSSMVDTSIPASRVSQSKARQASATSTMIVTEKDGHREETKILERCVDWKCTRAVLKPDGEIERSEWEEKVGM